MNDMFSMQGFGQQHTNGMLASLQREAESKAIKRMGAEAQIESIRILESQSKKLEFIQETFSALLKHDLEQAKLLEIASQERERIETERYLANMRLTKIAAWSGVVGTILALVAIGLQFIR